MTLLSPASLRPFDEEAGAEIHDLLQSNQAGLALDRLRLCEPRDRTQRIRFHCASVSASEHLGDFAEAFRQGIRALHLTSQCKDLRPTIRIYLAETLTRLGNLARAERVLQRCVAEIRTWGDDHSREPWALSNFGRIHFRRGTLSLAGRLYESAIELLGDGATDPQGWVAIRVNCSHALIRLGEWTRADEVLSEIEAPDRKLDPLHLAPLFLTRAMLGLESGDLEACERALARVDNHIVGDHFRYRLVWLQYEGALWIAKGTPDRALESLDQALQIARTHFPMDDMNAELSRLRATALLDLGRPQEALESAREAIRACGGSDMIDEPAGLRVAARCLAALGRREEAKASLAAALSLLEPTEFVVERGRLYAEMETLGMVLPRARPTISLRAHWPGGPSEPAHRLTLRDGRCFVTSEAELVDRIRVAAESRLPVLLEGETGTGKELVARLLHEIGSAREGPFVVVDCTTLTEALAEGELFGAARGAYTGAIADRLGLVGAADGGTLLFDELPELSLPAQSKLLRLLQEGTYRRLGESQPRRVQVRVIATTNQDADRLLALGALKADLFFRLQGYRIRLRPLRERPQDIALLAQEFASAEGLSGVTPDALGELQTCSWPGNARQLEMLIRVAASSLGSGRWLERPLVSRLLEEGPHLPAPSAERQRLQTALAAHSGNIAATARALNISRQGLYKALRRHGLI